MQEKENEALSKEQDEDYHKFRQLLSYDDVSWLRNNNASSVTSSDCKRFTFSHIQISAGFFSAYLSCHKFFNLNILILPADFWTIF